MEVLFLSSVQVFLLCHSPILLRHLMYKRDDTGVDLVELRYGKSVASLSTNSVYSLFNWKASFTKPKALRSTIWSFSTWNTFHRIGLFKTVNIVFIFILNSAFLKSVYSTTWQSIQTFNTWLSFHRNFLFLLISLKIWFSDTNRLPQTSNVNWSEQKRPTTSIVLHFILHFIFWSSRLH